MLPRPLDTTIAHKAINLMPGLSGTDKQIAGAIIDHFNRKTAQCDPGLERIAWLVGVSRRQVISSVSRGANRHSDQGSPRRVLTAQQL